MFDNRKQNVPQLFIDKINIDKTIDDLKKLKVINFYSLKRISELIKKQKELRRNCEMFCHMKKINQDGDGSPAGGTVGRYLDTHAVAA